MQIPQLPQPTPAAQAASHALLMLIKQEIIAQSGWISFARYMELALYAPQLGYYTGGATKLGHAGDFTTAPEISALFGATLARFAAQVLPQCDNQIMEFGAGTGKLAFDLLTELHREQCPPQRYYIVELSGELRRRQEDLLKEFQEVVWLDQMPAVFSGLVLGNEVLDAMPVQLVKKIDSDWCEVGVSWQERPGVSSDALPDEPSGQLVWADRPLADTSVLAQIPDAAALPSGYLTELHPVGLGFMASVAQMLKAGAAGAVLWIDYGFPAAEYYLPQRDQGTLMCHYRHYAHGEPFYWPGLQDITSHVDFSAVQQAGQLAGLDLLSYTSQAGYLLHSGIGELLLRTSPEDVRHYLPQSTALQKLISPAEMGELFKVVIMGINVALPKNLMQQDRRHRL